MKEKLSILSTIKSVPLSYFVYSSLSFFGRLRGGELPGMWFVRALGDAGRDTAAVRQTLYRMESEEELLARKAGRVKFYRATRYADAEIDTVLAKIFGERSSTWDGRWTMVYVNMRTPALRVSRERVVALLAVEGCALAGDDVYFHPRDVGARISAALSPAARGHVVVMRGRLDNDAAAPAIAELWNVSRLARRYRKVDGELRQVERLLARGASDRDAFILRFGVVFAFLGVAWDDPDLPAEILPRDWPADAVRRRAARLYDRLLPAALRHADALLADATQSLNARKRLVPQ